MKDIKTINMLEGISGIDQLIAISGREEGEKQRKHFNIDIEDKNVDKVKVIINKNIIYVSSSFFLGMFGASVRHFGNKEKFLEKYIFDCNELAMPSIYEAISDAIKRNGALG